MIISQQKHVTWEMTIHPLLVMHDQNHWTSLKVLSFLKELVKPFLYVCIYFLRGSRQLHSVKTKPQISKWQSVIPLYGYK